MTDGLGVAARAGEGGRGGAWAIGVSGLGWALGLVGVLVPVLSADPAATRNPPVAILSGLAMLLANLVSLIVAAVARRRSAGSAHGLAVAGLVLSILGLLGGLGVLGFGALLALAWGIGAAAAVGL